MPKQFLCFHCKSWHFDRFCPECGIPSGAGANSHLYTAKLDNHLYQQAETSLARDKEYAAMRAGVDKDPPRWAKKMAKEIVAGL